MDNLTNILCIGDNSSSDAWAHNLTKSYAYKNNLSFRGQVDNLSQKIEFGVYYTGLLLLTEKEICTIAKNFDKIVILDQSIDKFSHPHIFVSTWKLLNLLKNENTKIEIQNKSNMEFLDYWNNLLEKNKSFCLYPWVKSVSYNDHYTLCTQSYTPVTKKSEMKNWQTDKNFTNIRQKMIAGEKLKNCKACYDQEAIGKNVSIRRHETLEWAALLKLKSIKELDKIKSPSYFELRFSNKCNIKCRSCSGHYSHLIKKENNEIKDKKFQSLVMKEKFRSLGGPALIDWRNLKRVYIGGGDPTVQPELYRFLESCIENNNTNFELRLGINAVKISNKLFDLFKPFTNLSFSCSIDGTPKIDEYIRWGTKWDQKYHNIKRLKADGHQIAINFVLSIWNVASLGETLQFFQKEFPGSPVHFNTAGYEGDILSPFNFPASKKILQTVELAKNTKIYLNNEQRTQFLIDSLEKHYAKNNQYDKLKLSNFFYYNDILDKHRGSKLGEYIPELEECRKYVLEQ